MRRKTSLFIYEDDLKWCRDNNVLLSYALKKGVEILRKGDVSEELRVKIGNLSILLEKEVIKRQELEEKVNLKQC